MANEPDAKEDEDKSDEVGCWLIIGIVCVAIGAGQIWGSSVGWLAAGLAILLFVFVAIRNKP